MYFAHYEIYKQNHAEAEARARRSRLMVEFRQADRNGGRKWSRFRRRGEAKPIEDQFVVAA